MTPRKLFMDRVDGGRQLARRLSAYRDASPLVLGLPRGGVWEVTAVLSVVRPGGLSWVSTPNYGDWTLPAIERTFLEVVARAQGFSRAHIHPNRYDADRLEHELTGAGLIDVVVKKTPGMLALCATGRRP